MNETTTCSVAAAAVQASLTADQHLSLEAAQCFGGASGCTTCRHDMRGTAPCSWTANDGALVTVYADANNPHRHSFTDSLPCQLASMDQYCAMHNYSCYHFTASLEQWQAERLYADADGGFFKLQAVRTVLPFHAWVLYLDTDQFVSKTALSVDAAVRGMHWMPAPQIAATPSLDDASLLIHGHPGETWIASAFLVRNTAWAAAFLDHAWALREQCPNCQREQCAMNIAIFESVVMPAAAARRRVNDSGHRLPSERSLMWPEQLQIAALSQAPEPPLSCCNPREYCRYPDGRAGQSRPRQSLIQSRLAQACASIWLRATQSVTAPQVDTAEALRLERQTNVFWSDGFLLTFGLHHGVKNSFRKDNQDNMSTAIKGQPRNCAPYPAPLVNRSRSAQCMELALRKAARHGDTWHASSTAHEWRWLGCHTDGHANAAKFVRERNASSEYLAALYKF